MAQRRASARASRSRKAESSSSASAKAESGTKTTRALSSPPPEQETVDHAEHHELIARSLNGLLENFQEMRTELRTEMRVLKREVSALHKKFEQVEIDIREVRGRFETVTSAAFASDQTLRGLMRHVEELWGTAIDTAGERAAVVKARQANIEEELRRRGSELERRLADLSNPPENRK